MPLLGPLKSGVEVGQFLPRDRLEDARGDLLAMRNRNGVVEAGGDLVERLFGHEVGNIFRGLDCALLIGGAIITLLTNDQPLGLIPVVPGVAKGSSRVGGVDMHMLQTFWLWLTNSSDKAEKLSFKNQREAAEFVRRLYNESGGPNAKLKELYERGRAVRETEIAA